MASICVLRRVKDLPKAVLARDVAFIVLCYIAPVGVGAVAELRKTGELTLKAVPRILELPLLRFVMFVVDWHRRERHLVAIMFTFLELEIIMIPEFRWITPSLLDVHHNYIVSLIRRRVCPAILILLEYISEDQTRSQSPETLILNSLIWRTIFCRVWVVYPVLRWHAGRPVHGSLVLCASSP